jgi:hypothetical protein
MSDKWITVTKKKSNKQDKKKYIVNNHYNPKNKPKLKNIVKEKILKYCIIDNTDFNIFKTWEHFYIMGNITKNNSIYRIENSIILLEYFNKFKIYKNYKKGDEKDFIKIINNLNITKDILYENMKNNQLFYNNTLLQEHPLFMDIFLQENKKQEKQENYCNNYSFKEILKKNI